MKKELMILSQIAGFISRDRLVGVNDSYYYLWLCELQQWLRNNYKIDICVEPNKDNYQGRIFYPDGNEIGIDCHTNYESTLEICISNILHNLSKYGKS